jgi:hypothetical protein
LAAAFMLAYGAVQDIKFADAGKTLRKITVAELERGVVPSSTWVEVEGGNLLHDVAVVAKDYAKSTYVPLVSAQWAPNHPVAAVLRIFQGQMLASGRALRGALKPDGLPDQVRAALQSVGMRVANAQVIELGVVPSERLKQVKWEFAAAGALLVLAALQVYLLRRAARR